MSISYKGFNANVITMASDSNIKENCPVVPTADNRCEAASNGTNFIGISVHRRSELVSVQVEGYVEVKYTGTAPTYGYCGLVSAGFGVKVAENGVKYRVIKVDTDNSIVGFLL